MDELLSCTEVVYWQEYSTEVKNRIDAKSFMSFMLCVVNETSTKHKTYNSSIN